MINVTLIMIVVVATVCNIVKKSTSGCGTFNLLFPDPGLLHLCLSPPATAALEVVAAAMQARVLSTGAAGAVLLVEGEALLVDCISTPFYDFWCNWRSLKPFLSRVSSAGSWASALGCSASSRGSTTMGVNDSGVGG